MTNQIDISPRKQQFKKEYERLQRVYSELIAKRDNLLMHEGPYLEALYMNTIGTLQYEVLCLQYEIALLKLERDLLQAYANRGEEPEEDVVQEKVRQTAQTFNEKIHREEEKIQDAKTYIEEHPEEETKEKEDEKIEIKKIYKRLVHRLHPDLHPDQSEWERELFLKVQEAYRNEDLERLRQLEKELDAGMPSQLSDSDTIEDWEERIEKLKTQIAALRAEIKKIEHDFPFTYRKLLHDQEWVSSKQDDLRAHIEQLRVEKERLDKIVEVLRNQTNG